MNSPMQFPNEIVGALASWFADGAGPSTTWIDTTALAVGIMAPNDSPMGNKATRIAAYFRYATVDQAAEFAELTVGKLRDDGYLHADLAKFQRTRVAFDRNGGRLDQDGYLTWLRTDSERFAASVQRGIRFMDQARRTSMAVPAGTPAPTPPPRLAQPDDPTKPSHERLLWTLSRVPEAFQALVTGRRAGHKALDLVDEYDLQDATETALRLLYDDVRPEERAPSYAGSSTTQDFLLFEVKTMVEIKVTRPGRANRHIRDEIVIDSEAYQRHADVERMVFVVYDIAATITNKVGLEHDLSQPINNHRRDTLVVPWPYPAMGAAGQGLE